VGWQESRSALGVSSRASKEAKGEETVWFLIKILIRVGRGDLGVNRNRMEQIRQAFQQQGSP